MIKSPKRSMEFTTVIHMVVIAIAIGSVSSPQYGAAAEQQLTATKQLTQVVETDKGPVQGYISEGVAKFLGIPYAAPPVGNLRWRPPVAHARWRKVYSATKFAPICAQATTLGVYAGPRNTNEDCLYLNIFTPDINPVASRPVLVYLHGGGNFDGETVGYDGSKLASEGGIVVVTVEYRLNLMGFFAHPALDKEGHLFGNYGILDQQAALKWVQRNIAKFGGDKNNVTLGGQSAGAVDTMINMVSPLATGLFHRAICQSGCWAIYPAATRAAAEATGVAVAKAAGCGSGTDPEVAQCLRDLPAAKIEELAGTASEWSKFVIVPGIVDGQIVPDQPLTLLKDGLFNHVPLMTGDTRDEWEFLLAISEYWSSTNSKLRTPPTAKQYIDYVKTTFGPPQYREGTASKVLSLYQLKEFRTPQLAWNRVGSDAAICNVRRLTRILAPQIPVYAYEFADRSAPSIFPHMPGLEMQAYHTGDIQYLFPLWHGSSLGVQHPLDGRQSALSNEMISAWANFARMGNPNGLGNSPWPRYTINGDTPDWLIEEISGFSSLSDRQYSQRHHCDLWDSVALSKP